MVPRIGKGVVDFFLDFSVGFDSEHALQRIVRSLTGRMSLNSKDNRV